MFAQLDRQLEATVTQESILPVQLQNQHQDQLVTAALPVITVQALLVKNNADRVIIHQEVQKIAPQQMQVNTQLTLSVTPVMLIALKQLLPMECGPLLVIFRSVPVLEAAIALVVSRLHAPKVKFAIKDLVQRLLQALVCK